MKKIYYILIIFTILQACEKDEFQRFENEYNLEDVVKIELSPSSDYLYADGKAQLDFYLTAYYEHKVSRKWYIDGKIIDTTYLDTIKYKNRNLPEGLNIYTESGDLVENFLFSTNSTESEIQFYAEAGDIRSEEITVKLEQKPSLELEQYTIPVIIHVVETDDYKEQTDAINQEKAEEVINALNKLFSGEASPNAPHSIDLKVKFELASNNPQGETLDEIGINRVALGAMSESEAYDYLKENLLWDHKEYFNIWICQTSPWAHYYSFKAPKPKHVLTDPDILPGLNLVQVASVDDVEVTSHEDIGLLYAPAQFGKTEDVLKHVGEYFGLLKTIHFEGWGAPKVVDGDVDYCKDTYTWKRGATGIWKTTLEGGKMKSRNFMDDYSLGTIITYEQGMRIRNVIEHCPLRQHLK